jgi:transmembrane sensor
MIERRLSEKLTRNLDPSAIDEVWDSIEGRRARRRATRPLASWAFLGAAAVAAVLLFLFVKHRGTEASTALHLASGAIVPASLVPAGEVALDDGSHLYLDEAASLAPLVNTGRVFALAQASGRVTFDVKPHGPRAWTVDAGLARISVLGTRFRVSRERHRVTVEVERGSVLVASPRLAGGERTLRAGESIEVRDDETATADSAPVDAPAPSATALPIAPSPSLAAPAPSLPASSSALAAPWRPLVAKGDYDAAYDALGHENVSAETQRATSVDDLLQIADVARLSGHPADAVAPLERLVAMHAGDPRASTAAFTLGKVQLDGLSAPAPAAQAFEQAIALGLPGALREDAFARRVEAYAKSGDVARARAARAAYEESFAGGHHHEAVERWAP